MAGKSPLTEVLLTPPDGIRHVELPTPFPVGPVNAWLLTERPVTLVDPGMYFPESIGLLEDFLAASGLHVSDLDQVVLTHGHPDHFGLAGWIAENSHATLLCGRGEEGKILDRPWNADHARRVVGDLGLPEDVLLMLPAALELMRTMITHPAEDRLEALEDGTRLEAGGRIFDVHVTPGHAQGHLSLSRGDLLLSGDHLLPLITPNPSIEFDETSELGRRRSLVEYLATLDRFTRLDPGSVLPGHGPAFRDVPGLVRRMREHHRERAAHIHDVVTRLGPSSVYEVSRVLFPDLDGMSVMLGLSEVVGHLDLLFDEGAVVRSDDHPNLWAAA